MSRLETESGLVESLIQAARAIPATHLTVPVRISSVAESGSASPKFIVLWENSFELTQFILKRDAKEQVFSLESVFNDDMKRRRGLRAYGIKIQSKRSKINRSGSGAKIHALLPRLLSDTSASMVANPLSA